MMNDSTEPAYYRAPDSKVRPGDFVRLAPIYRALKPPVLHVGGGRESKKTRVFLEAFGIEDVAVPAAVAAGQKDTTFAVPGRMGLAVLLTRGCDVDHGRLRQLAMVRPLSTVGGADNQAAVIRGETTSLHFLPAATGEAGVLFERSYLDFRYTMTVDASLFDGLERPLALTRDALFDVYCTWLRHATGRVVADTVACPACGAPIELFAELQASLCPDVDF